MTDDLDPVDRSLRETAAVQDAALAPTWSHSPAARALLEEIHTMTLQDETTSTLRSTGPGPTRPRRRAGRLLAAAAVAALAVGGYAVVEVGPGSAERAPVAAADVVLAFSRTAAVQDAPAELPAGRYWYDRTTSTNLNQDGEGRAVRSESTYERWIAADGTGRTVNEVDGFGSQEQVYDGSAYTEGEGEDGSSAWGLHTFSLPRGDTYQDLLALPTDPDELYALIAARGEAAGFPGGGPVFAEVVGILTEPAPPALRAALFEVLARIPGITVETGVADRLGRVGTAVSLDDPEIGSRRQIIVDPATSTLLGRRDFQLAPAAWNDLGAGGLLLDLAVEAGGVVDSTDARL